MHRNAHRGSLRRTAQALSGSRAKSTPSGRPAGKPQTGTAHNARISQFGDLFAGFARWIAAAAGSPWAFLGGVIVTVVWAGLGPAVGYSDTWQLVINTGTTIATFLMVFLIQNTQNHEARVLQLKLDELIRALTPARTELVNMETMSDAQLETLQEEFEALRARAVQGLEKIEASRKSSLRSRRNDRA
jgi:low affinity Fe/Cu permease